MEAARGTRGASASSDGPLVVSGGLRASGASDTARDGAVAGRTRAAGAAVEAVAVGQGETSIAARAQPAAWSACTNTQPSTG